jgi:hypothetical protein
VRNEPGADGAGADRGSGTDPDSAAGANADPAPTPARPGLSERDLAVLALAGRGFAGPGARDRAVRERLGLSPARYAQLLNALLDDPRAMEHDPVTVGRLRRVREERRRAAGR